VIERSERGGRNEFRRAHRECIDPGSRSEAKADGSAPTGQAAFGFAAPTQKLRTSNAKSFQANSSHTGW
jgi:hypothetical protein